MMKSVFAVLLFIIAVLIGCHSEKDTNAALSSVREAAKAAEYQRLWTDSEWASPSSAVDYAAKIKDLDLAKEIAKGDATPNQIALAALGGSYDGASDFKKWESDQKLSTEKDKLEKRIRDGIAQKMIEDRIRLERENQTQKKAEIEAIDRIQDPLGDVLR